MSIDHRRSRFQLTTYLRARLGNHIRKKEFLLSLQAHRLLPRLAAQNEGIVIETNKRNTKISESDWR